MSDTTLSSVCPCDQPQTSLAEIPTGLSAIPRQTQTFRRVEERIQNETEVPSTLPAQAQTFPEVRRSLLAGVPQKPALHDWRARGERDFGLMWLEMWAYVADVLGFYDERITNESYIRTAALRPSLRRIVGMLGYVPAPGIAGSATIAGIVEGRTIVNVPARAGFRSGPVGSQPPQVFESSQSTNSHALANSWEIGPVPVSTAPSGPLLELIFETRNFGLGKNDFVLFTHPNLASPQVSKVTEIRPFEGKDKRTYLKVALDSNSPVSFAPADSTQPVDVVAIKVLKPRIAASITTNTVLSDPTDPESPKIQPFANSEGSTATTAYLDAIYRTLRNGDPVVVARETRGLRAAVAIVDLDEQPVFLPGSIALPGGASAQTTTQVTRLRLSVGPADDPQQLPLGPDDFDQGNPAQISFNFDFVDGGRLTRVAETEPTISALTNGYGVALTGILEAPPNAQAVGGGVKILGTRPFLLRDADNRGVLVNGKITFNADGTASFVVQPQQGDPPLPATLKTPITVFGNLLEVTRGESVVHEILGSGDGRTPRQSFKLKKKPLTYVFDSSVTPTGARSTLEVRVDQVLWREVRSFFGMGPDDQVFIVRIDDNQIATLTFGDGVRGARLPSGVDNVVASYRFGAGFASPLAGGIRQLAKAVKGLRRVESPIDALNGRDPDSAETLRTSAPRSALLFGHPVSAPDFEVLANLVPGVVTAVAEFLFIDTTQGAGIVVTYIGSAQPEALVTALQKDAEPGLAIDARRATPLYSTLHVEVEVDRRFDNDLVAAKVLAALIDPDTGPLAKKNAPIGRPLYRSTLFDVIHSVPGVVGVGAANGYTGYYYYDFQAAARVSLCAGPSVYFDFPDHNVTVSGFTSVSPVPADRGTT
jgi:hypothetical protein